MFQANSVLVSPSGTLDSPRALFPNPFPRPTPIYKNPKFGYGRQGRRASRSFADLYALASLQQKSGWNSGNPAKRRTYFQICPNSQSMDVSEENDTTKMPLSIQISCEDDSDIGSSKFDHAATSFRSSDQHYQHPSVRLIKGQTICIYSYAMFYKKIAGRKCPALVNS